eukprot:CAMPEP_0206425984 /NCGR_PEP_ID=MMETSP0324_2-20121206/4110_1 /ASSEMBLY_ACC=CAM_ASM_000836 /TAXON_ID=2866 /ORGANISM="Crypthecodinium cohnii, Strain Seligo" /LENGTH=323 /DNA_ID=CAMNT_0053890857 /DNA_START=127 /DNA_END=1098 /DNA_ORIENTATION=-
MPMRSSTSPFRRGVGRIFVLVPPLQFAAEEGSRKAISIPVDQGPSAVVLAVLPVAAILAPVPCRPLNGAQALAAILDKLTDISDASPPLHRPLSMNTVILELTSVVGTISSPQFSFTMRPAVLEVALVDGAVRPGDLDRTLSLASGIVALDHGAVDPVLRALPVTLVFRPKPDEPGAVNQGERATSMALPVVIIALVDGIVWIDDPRKALLRRVIQGRLAGRVTVRLSVVGFEPDHFRDELCDQISFRFPFEQVREGPGRGLEDQGSFCQVSADDHLVVLLTELGEVRAGQTTEDVRNLVGRYPDVVRGARSHLELEKKSRMR